MTTIATTQTRRIHRGRWAGPTPDEITEIMLATLPLSLIGTGKLLTRLRIRVDFGGVAEVGCRSVADVD